jgi:hypothetical protein
MSAISDRSKEEGLRDITNIYLPNVIQFDRLKAYADGQEREIEEMLQNMQAARHDLSSDIFMSEEENSTFNRMKSRQWLQSTEIEY